MTAPALAVTQPDGSRRYMHPLTGETVPSVTTILKVISKPQLDGWAARLTAKYAVDNWAGLSEEDPGLRLEILKSAHEETRQKSADRGTLVHELCDSWAKDNPVAIEKSEAGFMTQFFGFLEDVKPQYIESEATVWSHQYNYAGTFDFIAVINGEVTLVDIKTGKGVYPEYGMQLAALSHAECLVDEEGREWDIPKVARHAVLHLRPRSWKLIPVYEAEACFISFLAARKIWWWLHEVAPDVIGEPQ